MSRKMTKSTSPVLERRRATDNTQPPKYTLWVKNDVEISDRSYIDAFVVILGLEPLVAENQLLLLRVEQRVLVFESSALEVVEHYASLFEEDYRIVTEIKQV
jgi:hypothetical protein